MKLRTSLYTKGTVLYPLHSEVQKVHSPNLWERKCEVARTGSRIIFHLSKLWKAEKFNVDHSWEWKGQILFAFSQIVHELMVCPHTSIHLPPRLGLAARSSLSADIWGACQYLQSFVRSVPSVRPSVPYVRPLPSPPLSGASEEAPKARRRTGSQGSSNGEEPPPPGIGHSVSLQHKTRPASQLTPSADDTVQSSGAGNSKPDKASQGQWYIGFSSSHLHELKRRLNQGRWSRYRPCNGVANPSHI